jgi:transcriptional regulator GlxA family with amidase domain
VEACRLLSVTDKPTGSIALDFGLIHRTAFNKLFRRHLGRLLRESRRLRASSGQFRQYE